MLTTQDISQHLKEPRDSHARHKQMANTGRRKNGEGKRYKLYSAWQLPVLM